MPTPVTETSEGGQHVEWSETFHAFLFRARIYLKRFWWIVVLTVAVGAFVQKWKLRGVQPSFVSNAEMNVSDSVSLNTGASITEMLGNFFPSQIHLMKSEDLVHNAYLNTIANNEPKYNASMPQPVPDAEVIPGTSILHLWATGRDPQFTQDFLDTWMDDYLDSRKKSRDQIYKTYDNVLQGVSDQYTTQIEDLEKQEDDYINSHSFVSVAAAEKAAAETEDSLRGTNADIEKLNSQLQFLLPPGAQPVNEDQTAAPATTLPATGADAPPADADQAAIPTTPQPAILKVDKFHDYVYGNKGAGDRVDEIDHELDSLQLLPPNSAYETDKKQLLDLQVQYETLGLGLGAHHPLMTKLQDGIGQMQDTLRELRLQRVTQLEDEKNYLRIELDSENESRKKLEQMNKDDTAVKNEITKYENRIELEKSHNTFALQSAASLSESHQIAQDILQINLHATPAAEQMVDPLRPVTEGAFVGLAAGITIIFLLGALDGRIMSVEDLSQRFDEPMLGVIPMQKRVNGQVELLKHGDQRQMFAESCRNIRSSLLYMDRQGQRPRIIMLTSSMPSEGKSTLSSNLAITLGFAASRTLLVDADMRRGQLHKRFGLPNDLGLAEHIGQGVPLEKIIQPTQSENLDFISCGKYPAQPGELLIERPLPRLHPDAPPAL